MNKKTLGLLAALCLGATVTGCGKTEYSIGLGYTTEFTATQASVNVAVAAFDDAGKIVNARLDVVQIPLKGAAIDTSKNAGLLSKVELGTDYNMLASSKVAKKEVYEQIEAFADWTVGKTVEEVIAGTPGAGHGVAVNDELATSVTITVDAFEGALKDAYETRGAAVKGTAKGAGVGIYVEMYGANELTAYIAGATTTKKGKVEAALVDNVVFPLLADAEGGAALDTTSKYYKDGAIISKKKLGEDYKMDDLMPACTEDWYKQAAHIEGYLVGKTAEEIDAMTYTDGKNAELSELGATIIVESIMKSVSEAANYATKEVITAKPVAR